MSSLRWTCVKQYFWWHFNTNCYDIPDIPVHMGLDLHWELSKIQWDNFMLYAALKCFCRAFNKVCKRKSYALLPQSRQADLGHEVVSLQYLLCALPDNIIAISERRKGNWQIESPHGLGWRVVSQPVHPLPCVAANPPFRNEFRKLSAPPGLSLAQNKKRHSTMIIQ